MLVKIKPIHIEKWHGKSAEEAITQPKKIRALVNPKTGKYETGLTPEEVEKLQKETNFDLSDKFNPIVPHPFWDSETAVLTLPNHTIILDTNNPLDYIKYKLALASKFVANSYLDYENGLYPEATHYIENEEEEAKIKAKKAEQKAKAFAIVSKLTRTDKENIILILTGKNLRKQSNDFIEAELADLIEKMPANVIEFANKDKTYLNTKAMLLEGVIKGVISKKGESYYYLDHLLGADIENAVKYLLDPKNQELKIAILEKIS